MPSESYAFVVRGLEPAHDHLWMIAPEATRKAFWQAIVKWVLSAKDAELRAGLDKDGQPLHPIAEATRRKGRWRSHTGLGSADAPPLTPAYRLSRTRDLLDGRAHWREGYALFFWRVDEATGEHWGRILGYHRAGAGRLPVRDVIGLSSRAFAEVKAKADRWWADHKAGRTEEPEKKEVVRSGRPTLRRIVPTGRTDLHNFTFGIGGTSNPEDIEAMVRRAHAAGTATGFRQLHAEATGTKAVAKAPPKPPRIPLGVATRKKAALPAKTAPKPTAGTKAERKVKTKPAPTPYTQTPARVESLRTRMAGYREGDNKVRDLQRIGEEIAAKKGAMDVARRDVDAALGELRGEGGAPGAVAEGRVAAAERALAAAQQALASAENRERLRALQVLGLAEGHTLTYDHGGSIDSLPQYAREASEGAIAWLSRVTARGKTFRVQFALDGLPKGVTDGRAFYGEGVVHLPNFVAAKTAVHEIGHMLEAKVPGWGNAAQAFLRHRVGDEDLAQLRSLPGRGKEYDADEWGRKDRFDETFGDAAWYVGKDYGFEASEITSMGLEKLFSDPVGFARKDPEFVKFLIGCLHGVLL